MVRRKLEADSRFFIVSNNYTSADLPVQSMDGCFVLMAGGVLLREHALYMVSSAAVASNVCLVYSDETPWTRTAIEYNLSSSRNIHRSLVARPAILVILFSFAARTRFGTQPKNC